MLEYLKPDKTCILINNNEIIFSSKENGIIPLVKYIYYNGLPKTNTILIDKVIGMAIANVVVFSQITTVFTNIISKPALDFLIKHGVDVHYTILVENILRYDKTDICPIEKRVLTLNNPNEVVELLYQIVIK
ncbi:MAG TPA: DUF1893 domain-containing protein [Haloplasmataceae bacterium]